jgi:hypothetical protein
MSLQILRACTKGVCEPSTSRCFCKNTLPSPRPGDEAAVVSRKDDGGSCSQAFIAGLSTVARPVDDEGGSRAVPELENGSICAREQGPSDGGLAREQRRGDGRRAREQQPAAGRRCLETSRAGEGAHLSRARFPTGSRDQPRTTALMGEIAHPCAAAVTRAEELAGPPPRPSGAPRRAVAPWPPGTPLLRPPWLWFDRRDEDEEDKAYRSCYC